MNKVYFMNNGNFDIRAMITMGVSVKENNAIGFFGTGFKYAVAIILRLGGKINIKTISGEYSFTARNETIRGKDFQIVYLNDQEAGFTTHLGINWEPWKAYRELFCNATDEGGTVDTKPISSYDTIIEVESDDIFAAHHNRYDYFLQSAPIYKNHEAEMYKQQKPFIYYRGIAVMPAYKKALFSYNITKPIDLTEDRTVRSEYQIRFAIQKLIQNCTDKNILRECLQYGDHAEALINFDKDWGVSNEFIAIGQELMNKDRGICESARQLLSSLEKKAGNWPEFTPSMVQTKMIEKAKRLLLEINADVDQYPIKTVKGLGNGVMGRAHEETIYLSELVFNYGTKQVASTLLEEWVHLKYNVADFDRQMQNWLFDKVISLAEELNGDPI